MTKHVQILPGGQVVIWKLIFATALERISASFWEVVNLSGTPGMYVNCLAGFPM